MAGGPYGGKWGVVNGVAEVRDWSINDAHDSKPYVDSATLFGHGRVRGIESWDGSYQHYGAVPVIMPGEIFQFVGYGAPLNFISGNGWRYVGNALCESAVINWNWGAGDIISVQESFKGHLNLTEQGSSGAEVLDSSTPNPPTIACTKIQYSTDNGSNFVDWNSLLTAALTFSCALQEYVNSGTIVDDAGTCRIWKGYVPGPIDWKLAVTEQDVQRSLFKKSDNLVLRLFINGVNYYELKWGMVKDFTGISVNRETGAIVSQTVNIEMNGFSGSTGHILMPNGTTYWPGHTGTGT